MPPKGRRTSRDRSIDTTPTPPPILIVCEGQVTEPNYFRGFRVTKDIRGVAMGTLRLVQEAKTIRDAENEIRCSKGLGRFKQVWCVFDLDDNRLTHNKTDFEKALQLANTEKMQVAYSNDAFELWYVLHFDYLQSQAHRSGYITMLEKPNLLNRKY